MTPACVLRRGHLGISLPMASKHVTRLEQHPGTGLLNGKRRLVTLAENAALYFEQIQQMLMRLDEGKQRSGSRTCPASNSPYFSGNRGRRWRGAKNVLVTAGSCIGVVRQMIPAKQEIDIFESLRDNCQN